MLNINDLSAIRTIRNYFDELGWRYINNRMIPGHDSIIFPNFAQLQETLKGFSNIYRFLFTIFRQGHAADEAAVRAVLPGEVFEAMVETGLLVRNSRGQWRTPGFALVPLEGLYLVVSLPPYYPTAITRKQPIYIGTESIWLARALPPSLAGRRVLDVCAGSGIQALVCASRGALRVVGLEKDPEAVNVARFNAALNGFPFVVEIRESDLFSSLNEDEKFDFVVSNPPFMPVMEDVDYPMCGAGGADGIRTLSRIFEGLPGHLSQQAEGIMFCDALGGQTSINFNQEFLPSFTESNGLRARAYVSDKMPISDYIQNSLEGNLINSCPELSPEARQTKISRWQEELNQRGVPADYIYAQIIHFWKGRSETGIKSLPAYNPYNTDPLMKRAAQNQSYA